MVWNIPVACNRATADFMISSPLLRHRYQRQEPDFTVHAVRQRAVAAERDQVASRTAGRQWAGPPVCCHR